MRRPTKSKLALTNFQIFKNIPDKKVITICNFQYITPNNGVIIRIKLYFIAQSSLTYSLKKTGSFKY